jgi:hypothetical protein
MWPSAVQLVMASLKNLRLWVLGFLLIFSAQTWADSASSLAWGAQHTSTFAQEVRAAVKANDVRHLSLLTSFPLQVNLANGRSIRMTRSHFHRYFSQVFTPRVRSAVESQSISKILENGQGTIYGIGDVWFGGVCVDKSCSRRVLKIKVVNVF